MEDAIMKQAELEAAERKVNSDKAAKLVEQQ